MSTAGMEDPTLDETDSIVAAVLQAVADHEDTTPTALDPALYDVIDPAALDALFAPTEAGSSRTAGQVVFSYCGYEVTVDSDGHVTVDALTATDHDAQSRSSQTE